MTWETRVTQIFNIEYLIVQGDLDNLAYSDLASAVSEAGGLGQITAMSLESPEALRKEIKQVRQLTDKPFGINFAIGQHKQNYEEMVQVAIDEKVSAVS